MRETRLKAAALLLAALCLPHRPAGAQDNPWPGPSVVPLAELVERQTLACETPSQAAAQAGEKTLRNRVTVGSAICEARGRGAVVGQNFGIRLDGYVPLPPPPESDKPNRPLLRPMGGEVRMAPSAAGRVSAQAPPVDRRIGLSEEVVRGMNQDSRSASHCPTCDVRFDLSARCTILAGPGRPCTEGRSGRRGIEIPGNFGIDLR